MKMQNAAVSPCKKALIARLLSPCRLEFILCLVSRIHQAFSLIHSGTMGPLRSIKTALSLCFGMAIAQDVFSGVWKPGTATQIMFNSTDWTIFT